MVWKISSVFVTCLIQVFMKLLFTRIENFNVSSLITLRSLIQVFCVLIAINTNARKILVDSVPRNLAGKLFGYSLSNAFIIFAVTYSVSKIPLV